PPLSLTTELLTVPLPLPLLMTEMPAVPARATFSPSRVTEVVARLMATASPRDSATAMPLTATCATFRPSIACTRDAAYKALPAGETPPGNHTYSFLLAASKTHSPALSSIHSLFSSQ